MPTNRAAAPALSRKQQAASSRCHKLRRSATRGLFVVAVVLTIVVQLSRSPGLDDDNNDNDNGGRSFLRESFGSYSNSIPDAYFNNYPVRLKDTGTGGYGGGAKKGTSSALYDEAFHSTVHCVGETHDETTAWKHRSCSYVHLCLDTRDPSSPEFFVVASRFEDEFRDKFRFASSGNTFRYSSTELLGIHNNQHNKNNNKTTDALYSPIDVAVGGINPSWKATPSADKRFPYEHGVDKIRWAPRVYESMPFRYYYELEEKVVMVPYHSFAAANVGHLLWDDFLPVYNLLKIFGYEANRRNKNNNDGNDNGINGNAYHQQKSGYEHLLLRIDTMTRLYGTCDLRPKRKEDCRQNIERFLPLFGIDPNTFSTLTEARLTRKKRRRWRQSQQQRKNDNHGDDDSPPRHPVCSKHAVAGQGWLTDHGTRSHGWMANHEEHSLDAAIAVNAGRGPELYAFRNFMLRNIGFHTTTTTTDPGGGAGPVSFRVLLSAESSRHPDRSFGLVAQGKAIADAFPTTEVSVVNLSEMLLMEQIKLVSGQPKPPSGSGNSYSNNLRPRTHTIFVSACGGGSATAYFLPRGSTLVLYYNEVGGHDYFADEKPTGGPALLDWDLMNNLGYLRTHWLPIGSMEQPEGLDALVYLIKHEMDAVIHGMVA